MPLTQEAGGLIGRTILAGLLGILVPACTEPTPITRSVVLSGGAYVRIANRWIPGQPQDSTSLAALSSGEFSVEIWAAGDSLPPNTLERPSLFTISNAANGTEIGIFRAPFDSSAIFVILSGQFIPQLFSIPGCDWNDPDLFVQVVLTYDGNTLTLYGNGTRLGNTTLGANIDVFDSDALIGAEWGTRNDPATLDNFWYGAIDEVRLWTIVLQEGEMAFRYNNPGKLTRHYSPTGLDPLIGLWRFNRAGLDGDPVLDGSGKGNDAVLNKAEGQLDFTDAGS